MDVDCHSTILQKSELNMVCECCLLDVEHLGCLIDERLDDYQDKIDEEFIQSQLGDYDRERARGKLIAIEHCRKILSNVILQMIEAPNLAKQ